MMTDQTASDLQGSWLAKVGAWVFGVVIYFALIAAMLWAGSAFLQATSGRFIAVQAANFEFCLEHGGTADIGWLGNVSCHGLKRKAP